MKHCGASIAGLRWSPKKELVVRSGWAAARSGAARCSFGGTISGRLAPLVASAPRHPVWCIDAGSWLVDDPLGRIDLDLDEDATAWWSIQREHVDQFLAGGYLVAEVEPESFEPIPGGVIERTPPEVAQLALTVPLHRRTLSLVERPVESVSELRRLTARRVVGPAPGAEIFDLARSLLRPGGRDVDQDRLVARHWSALRHREVVLGLAGAEAPAARCAPAAATDPAPSRPAFAVLPGGAALGRTPVTVAAFAAFVDDGGYGDDRWWRAGEDRRSGPDRFDEQRPFPQRPVVGVDFWEAKAYTRWFSSASGIEARLPTLAEWQGACGSPFPWGAEPDAIQRANFGQRIGNLTDVAAHPGGAGPYGHLDLAGNCWEWLADPAGEGRRSVVGGGWFTKLEYLRSDYSFEFDEHNRFRDLGFRVASVAEALPERNVR